MNEKIYSYPFTAIAGQEKMKEAILLNLVDRSIGGVLISGQKGTGKTTAVRAVPGMMKDTVIIEIPANATEDRVAGTIDIEAALSGEGRKFQPGLLKEVDGNILYVDEVNLLDDSIVDIILDAAATGRNTVEREGISCTHPSRFVLIGTMNPEEGELRPQLLDRFALYTDVTSEDNPDIRVEIIKRRLMFEKDPEAFAKQYEDSEENLRRQIEKARGLLEDVRIPDEIMHLAAEISIEYGIEGHRADIGMIKTAAAHAALEGRTETEKRDLKIAAEYVLPHRMRRNAFEKRKMNPEILERILSENHQRNNDFEKDGAKDGKKDGKSAEEYPLQS